MKLKLLFTIFLSILLSAGFAQSITTTESFDNTTFVPVGWSQNPNLGTQNLWSRRTNGTNGPTVVCNTHSGAGLARFSSRTAAAGTQQSLVTKVVDYSNRGTNAATISLWMFRDSFLVANSDSLTIWVNTVDSISSTAVMLGSIARNRSIAVPDTQAMNDWYQYSFNVPASFNTTTNFFILQGTSQSAVTGQGANIFIDDISYDEYPPICNGVPTIGSVLASTTTICGGSGTSNLSLSITPSTTNGINYLWQESASSSGPWTTFGTNLATATTNTLTASTYVRCISTCTFSALHDTTPALLLNVSLQTPPTISISSASNTVCNGDSLSLYPSGATIYSWAISSTLMANGVGDTAIVFPTTPSQYTVYGTDANGCSASTSINVNVSNSPNNVSIISNPSDTICAGQAVLLNSVNGGPTNGYTYLWSDGVTTRRDTIYPTSNITLSVIVTNQAGCSASDSVSITVNPATVGNFGLTQVGSTFTFSDSTLGSTAWFWEFGDGNSSMSQNPTYTFSSPGIYTVTLIVTGSCGNDTVTQQIAVWPTNISDISTNDLVIFPNPSRGEVAVQVSNAINNASIYIYSISGKLVETLKTNSTSEVKFSTNGWRKGIYFVEMNDVKRKLIVE